LVHTKSFGKDGMLFRLSTFSHTGFKLPCCGRNDLREDQRKEGDSEIDG
jgi:hypothetical protein